MEWLTYLLKVTACMAVFYAFYHFFLQRLTFFGANRIYLLATLLTSFAVPVLQFEIERNGAVAPQEALKVRPVLVDEVTSRAIQTETVSTESAPAFQQSAGYDWEQLLYTAYVVVTIVVLIIFLTQMWILLKHARNVNTTFGRLKVVYKPTGFTNCSFLNYVFVDQQDLTGHEINILLQHETVHASKYHSADKLLITLGKIVLWFNPFIYLYDKALEQVHEYQADKEASSSIGNASYARLLLNMSVRKNNIPLVHNFVKNPLKERIKMLFTSQSKNMKKLAYLTCLPLLAILLWSFSVSYVYKEHVQNAEPKSAVVKEYPLPIDTLKYRQKVKWTPEMEKARAEHDVWIKTDDARTKSTFARSLRGKNIEVLVKGEIEEPFGSRMLYRLLVEYQNKDYYLSCNIAIGAEEIRGMLKPGDKLEVLVFTAGYSQKPMISIEAEKIVKDGHLIFEMKKPKIDPNAKPAPFLFEANRVRFNNGVITKAGSVVAGKRTMEVSANGYKFLIKINSNQVALSELASFKEGDKVSLRFVHEVKTGALTYSIKDWVAISKDMMNYGVKNKQMFYRFYEKVKKDESTAAVKKDLIEYSAVDSLTVDTIKKILTLYGKANLKYKKVNITADEIMLNFKDKTGVAKNLKTPVAGIGIVNAERVDFSLK